MSRYIDQKFVNLVSPQLKKFKWKKKDMATCRCPLCGDSEKNQNKCRFYIYADKDGFACKCHNCGYSNEFGWFLKRIDSNLHRDYTTERFVSDQGLTSAPFVFPEVSEPEKKAYLTGCKCIADMSKDHYAVRYVSGRKIPKDKWKKLFFCEDFMVVVKEFDTEKLVPNDARLVIPFYDEKGELFALQGRVLSSASKEIRYITIKVHGSEKPKIYGLDTFDKTKHGLIVEGPIDSLFLPNCLALSGSSNSLEGLGINQNTTTFVFDNEPRNKYIVEEMKDRVEQGFSVCVWPLNIKEKDINDMVLKGLDPLKIIQSSTFSGLAAKMAISNWSKV